MVDRTSGIAACSRASTVASDHGLSATSPAQHRAPAQAEQHHGSRGAGETSGSAAMQSCAHCSAVSGPSWSMACAIRQAVNCKKSDYAAVASRRTVCARANTCTRKRHESKPPPNLNDRCNVSHSAEQKRTHHFPDKHTGQAWAHPFLFNTHCVPPQPPPPPT